MFVAASVNEVSPKKIVTEWPTVSTKHVPHLGRQFSVTVMGVKARFLVVNAGLVIAVSLNSVYPDGCLDARA